ncbi:hypothetical protein CYMTET_27501 [Cymbomonas tetramitiformis]|uniref:Uncharacterized protein n=1 Tax=Cymbomonas tetramitiformis TaxID=36881 RepID=A0AAE0FQ87_9CHLO|nr:hypothetical protein CYMTET_27501 [Cymbomonas tetramitiformis]
MSDNEAEEDKTSLNDEDIDGWVSDGDLSGLDDEDVDLALADLDTPKKAAAKVKESSSTESDVKFLDSKSATFDVVATSVEPTKDVEAVAAEVSTAESVAESVPESLDGEPKVPSPTEARRAVAESLPESVGEEQKASSQGQVSPAAAESVPEPEPFAEPVVEVAAAPDVELPEKTTPAKDASQMVAPTVDTAEEQSASVLPTHPSPDDLTPAPEGKLQGTLEKTAAVQKIDEQKVELNAENVASSKPAEDADGDLNVASSKPADDTEGNLPLQDGPLTQADGIQGDATEAEGDLEPEQSSDFTFSEAKSGHTAEGLPSREMDSPQPLPKALDPPPAAQDCPPPVQEISADEDGARLAGLDRLSMLAEEEPAWGGWGFGGWAKKAVANVSKTVVNVSTVVGEAIENAGEEVGKKLVDLNENEKEDEDGGHEGKGERGEAPTGPAIEDERKRQELLARLEGNETQLEDNLKALDDKVELLANNAWSAIGTAWTGGLKLAQNAASTAAEELKQGMEEVKEIQAQGGGGGFFGGLKAGIEFLKGDREGDGEMGFADISFEHCFYINGGLDFVEVLAPVYPLSQRHPFCLS